MSGENHLTWSDLVQIEPRLQDLEREVKAVKDPGRQSLRSFCANAIWIERFKPRVRILAGWYAGKSDSRIKTPEAYDLAYEHLYQLLPPCRGCTCA